MKIVDKTSTPAKADSLVVFDETVEGEKFKLHLLVEYPRTSSRVQTYFSALRDSRAIPFDLEAINPLDPMYRYVKATFPALRDDDEAAKRRVQFFYGEQARQAERDAVILAVTSSKDNVFTEEPKPYVATDFESEDDLPGVATVPQPERHLDNPTERRLKQIYDALASDPTMLIPFTKNFELAVIRINNLLVAGSTDDAGFQPEPTNSVKNQRAKRSDLQPQA